jgi:predicted AAA+ superfamily ATPase
MDVLKKEIPVEDLDGDTIHTSRAFMVEVKKGKSVDESFIANRRNILKLKYFLYKRKKARWHSTFSKIHNLTVEPKTIEQAYLTRKIHL